MNEFLMQAIAESLLFFGLCSEDECPEDVAVAQLEQTAAILKGLKLVERNQFCAFMKHLARHEVAQGNPQRADFLSSVCDNLGLGELLL